MAYEIDFLAVGDGERSGDAIALRYSDGYGSKIHVVDGGDLAAGKRLVEHINKYYGNPSYIDAVVCTHGDDDHSSGLRRVIENFYIREIWMNRPWLYAQEILDLFRDRRLTAESLERHLRDSYPILVEIEDIACKRGIAIRQAFQGMTIGEFTILAPSRERYLQLIPQFSRTPEQAKSPNVQESRLLGAWSYIGKTTAAVTSWIAEEWNVETIKEDVETSASNESSVVQIANLNGSSILLTGDAGVISLQEAANYAPHVGFNLPGIDVIQIPHHGSRRNVSPSTLNRWIGPIVQQGESHRSTAYVSTAKESKTHPRKKVVNAFIRRGAKVYSTKGSQVYHRRGISLRRGWRLATPHGFSRKVEID